MGTETLSRLTDGGFSNLAYMDPATHLLDGGYIRHLQHSLTATHLGEIPLPANMKASNSVDKVGIHVTGNGFGHIRLGQAFHLLMDTLGINNTLINLSDPESASQRTLLGKFFSNLKPRYERASIRDGVAQQIAPISALDSAPIPNNMFHTILNTLESKFPKSYQEMIMGKPNPSLTRDRVLASMNLLRQLVGREYQSFVDSQQITHHLALYPFINALLADPILTVGTDSVLEPRGWLPFKKLLVQTEQAAALLKDFWGERFEQNITVTDGFPSPIGAMMHRDAILKERVREAAAGKPIYLIFPASGAAWSQAESFAKGICQISASLNDLNLRVIVHCGAGTVGKQVLQYIERFIEPMDEKIKKHIYPLYSPSAVGAVDFYEALISSPLPVVVVSKASEQACIARQVGLPLFVTGTIGEHEKWNAITNLISGLPMLLLPAAYQQVVEKVNSAEFPLALQSVVVPLLEQSYADTLESAVKRARELIVKGYPPAVNRGMMLDSLTTLLQ